MEKEEKDEFSELIKKKWFQNLLLLVSVLITVGSFFVVKFTKEEGDFPFLPQVIEEQQKQNETVEEAKEMASFEEFTKNLAVYDRKEVELTGYLQEEIKKSKTGAGIYEYFITDDYRNKIKLTNLKKEYLDFLKKSEKQYMVKGEFRGMYIPKMRVKEIS